MTRIDWKSAPCAEYAGPADPSVPPMWPDRAADAAHAEELRRLREVHLSGGTVPPELGSLHAEIVGSTDRMGMSYIDVIDACLLCLSMD